MKQIVIVSSHLQKIFKTDVLKNFAKLTEKHLLRSLFLISLKTNVFFFKMRLRHRCFLVNFAKILRIPFLQNISGLLLMYSWNIFLILRNLFLILRKVFPKSKLGKCQNFFSFVSSDSVEFVNKHCQKSFRIWSYSGPCSV